MTLPELTKNGYSCTWREGSSSGTAYAGGTVRTITSDTSYYASCVPNNYTVSFNANGGTGRMDAATVVNGQEITLPANAFTRENFVFDGWATTSGGAVVYANGAKVTVANNMTLYAVWKQTSWNNTYMQDFKQSYCDTLADGTSFNLYYL